MMILACLMMAGCHSDSERLADLADRTMQMQGSQNRAAAAAQSDFMQLNSTLQTERNRLNQQFNALEQNRRDLHQLRRSALAWAESFQFLGIIIAAVMPLFLCTYLVWAGCQQTANHEAINELLMNEFVSPRPRLIAAPNLLRIEHHQEVNQDIHQHQTHRR